MGWGEIPASRCQCVSCGRAHFSCFAFRLLTLQRVPHRIAPIRRASVEHQACVNERQGSLFPWEQGGRHHEQDGARQSPISTAQSAQPMRAAKPHAPDKCAGLRRPVACPAESLNRFVRSKSALFAAPARFSLSPAGPEDDFQPRDTLLARVSARAERSLGCCSRSSERGGWLGAGGSACGDGRRARNGERGERAGRDTDGPREPGAASCRRGREHTRPGRRAGGGEAARPRGSEVARR